MESITINPPPTFEQATQESGKDIALSSVQEKASLEEEPLTDAIGAWLSAAADLRTSYPFRYMHRKQMSQGMTRDEYLTKLGALRIGDAWSPFADEVPEWLCPPEPLREVTEVGGSKGCRVSTYGLT